MNDTIYPTISPAQEKTTRLKRLLRLDPVLFEIDKRIAEYIYGINSVSLNQDRDWVVNHEGREFILPPYTQNIDCAQSVISWAKKTNRNFFFELTEEVDEETNEKTFFGHWFVLSKATYKRYEINAATGYSAALLISEGTLEIIDYITDFSQQS
jgi:hypothetical protein